MRFLDWLFRKTHLDVEAKNLRRWQESGQAQAWIEARQGHWNHADWLALLDQLRHSPFWPLQSEAVGRVLEEMKGQWLQQAVHVP